MEKKPLVIKKTESLNGEILFRAICEAWSLNAKTFEIIIEKKGKRAFTSIDIKKLKDDLLPAFQDMAKKINEAEIIGVPETKNFC